MVGLEALLGAPWGFRARAWDREGASRTVQRAHGIGLGGKCRLGPLPEKVSHEPPAQNGSLKTRSTHAPLFFKTPPRLPLLTPWTDSDQHAYAHRLQGNPNPSPTAEVLEKGLEGGEYLF